MFPGLLVVGRDFETAFEMSTRCFHAAQIAVYIAQVEVGEQMVRRQRQGLFEPFDGRIEPAASRQRQTQIVGHVGVPGAGTQGQAILFHCLIITFLAHTRIADIIMRVWVARIDAQRFLVGRDGLLDFILLKQRVAQIVPGQRKIRIAQDGAPIQGFGFGMVVALEMLVSKVVQSIDVLRIGRDRRLVLSHGLVALVQARVHIAQLHVGFVVSGLRVDRREQFLLGLIEPVSSGMGDAAMTVPGRAVGRVVNNRPGNKKTGCRHGKHQRDAHGIPALPYRAQRPHHRVSREGHQERRNGKTIASRDEEGQHGQEIGRHIEQGKGYSRRIAVLFYAASGHEQAHERDCQQD